MDKTELVFQILALNLQIVNHGYDVGEIDMALNKSVKVSALEHHDMISKQKAYSNEGDDVTDITRPK